MTSIKENFMTITTTVGAVVLTGLLCVYIVTGLVPPIA
jgi:hypothetical protein